MSTATSGDTSAALALAKEIKNCRDCQCFWPPDPAGTPLPFGRFGPVPVSANLPKTQGAAVTVQAGMPDPALLKGCRRAPAMLVGINPNLKNFGAGLRGEVSRQNKVDEVDAGIDIGTVHWCDSDTTAHMRHYRWLDPVQVLPQIEFKEFERCVDSAKRWVVPALSEGATMTLMGYRTLTQGQPNREAALNWTPDTVQVDPTIWAKEVSWGSDENFVVLRAQADAGQLAAGYLTRASLQNKSVQVRWKNDGFYTHLGTLAHAFGGVPGEDLALVDMAACASARWHSNAGVNEQEVRQHCVKERRFALRQVLDARPEVLFFSGREAWGMFVESYQAHATKQGMAHDAPVPPTALLQGLHTAPVGCNEQGEPDTDPTQIDVQAWLRQQAQPGLLATAQLRTCFSATGWACRLVPMAHFSYSDNVTALVHWPRDVHQRFERNAPLIVAMLKADQRWLDPTNVKAKYRPVFFGISLKPSGNDNKTKEALKVPEPMRLQALCEDIVNRIPSTKGLVKDIPAMQWEAAQREVDAHLMRPMSLAARIAQMALGVPGAAVTPTSMTQSMTTMPDTVTGTAMTTAPRFPLGRFERRSVDCGYCPASGGKCDYLTVPSGG